MQKIAIEPDLTPIKKYLGEMGYHVENINFNEESSKKQNIYDAYVVTGLNSNFLGINDTSSKAIVVDASGLSPEQVYHELQLRL